MMKMLLALVFSFLLPPPAWTGDQVIVGGSSDNLLDTATEVGQSFGMPENTYDSTTFESNKRSYLSPAGTVKNFRVVLDGAPGAGTSYEFRIRLNGADTSPLVGCTISGTATSCVDTSNTVAVVGGDYVTFSTIPTGTPAVTDAMQTWVLDSTTSGETMLHGNSASTSISASATLYGPLSGAEGGWESTEANTEIVVPLAGTLKNLRVVIGGNPGADKSYAFTARINESSPANGPTCTIAGGTDTSCTDLTNTATVVAGDRIGIQVVPSGTPTTRQVRGAVLTFATGTDGDFFIASTDSDAMATCATSYTYLQAGDAAGNATEGVIQQIGQVMTITAIYVDVSGAPGAGTSYQFTLFQNEGTTGLTCTISGASATTCNSTGTVTIAADDRLDTQIIPSGTPTGRTAKISYYATTASAAARRVFMVN